MLAQEGRHREIFFRREKATMAAAVSSKSRAQQHDDAELLGNNWLRGEVDNRELARAIDGFFDIVADYESVECKNAAGVDDFKLRIALDVLNAAMDRQLVRKDVPQECFDSIVRILTTQNTRRSRASSLNEDIFESACKFLSNMSKSEDAGQAFLAANSIKRVASMPCCSY